MQDLWVEYDGEIRHSTIEGTWTIVRGYGAGTFAGVGTFLLMQESHKPNAKRSTPGVLPLGEPHHWTGYYKQKGFEFEMSTDLLFADNLKVYGSGTDSIGRYTWLGTNVNPSTDELPVWFLSRYLKSVHSEPFMYPSAVCLLSNCYFQ